MVPTQEVESRQDEDLSHLCETRFEQSAFLDKSRNVSEIDSSGALNEIELTIEGSGLVNVSQGRQRVLTLIRLI